MSSDWCTVDLFSTYPIQGHFRTTHRHPQCIFHFPFLRHFLSFASLFGVYMDQPGSQAPSRTVYLLTMVNLIHVRSYPGSIPFAPS
jgi:hypothetical protein